MKDPPIIICTLDYLDIASIRDSWGGFYSIAPLINTQKVEFAHLPDQPHMSIRIVGFQAIVRTNDVTEYAARHQMRVAGPEWLSVVNSSCSFPGRPLVALASPSGLTNGATLYSRRTTEGIELSMAWGQFGWSTGCLFLLTAPI